MIEIESISKTLIIIGNGFDRNLGLKTGYNDFIESHYFTSMLSNNKLAQYLSAKAQLQNWIDIESELSVYAKICAKNGISKDKAKHDYLNVKQSLKNYLTNEIVTNQLKTDSFAWEFMMKILENTEWPKEKINVVDFNYTDTIEHFPKLKPKNPRHIRVGVPLDVQDYFGEIKYMHGKLSGSDIVFGVEDGAVDRDSVFLLKATQLQVANGTNKSHDVYSLLKNNTNIIFIGYSLGKTDHHYFKQFFDECLNGKIKNKNLFFTIYNNDYDSIRGELYEITEKRITQIQNKINIKFIPVEKAQFKIKGQIYSYPTDAEFENEVSSVKTESPVVVTF